MSRPCQAEDSDGDECDCEDFAPKKTKRMSAEGAFTKDARHPEADRDTVTSILHKARAEHEPAATSGSGSSLLSQAKRESLGGMRAMRPKSRKLTKGTSKGASKSSARSTRPRSKTVDEPASNATFMVDGVILLTAGLVEDGNTFGLPDDSIPNKAEIQTLVNRGVAYYKPNGRGIPHLTANLPQPMRYFEEAGDIKFTDDEGNSVMCSNTFFNSHGIPQKKSGETVIQSGSPEGNGHNHAHILYDRSIKYRAKTMNVGGEPAPVIAHWSPGAHLSTEVRISTTVYPEHSGTILVPTERNPTTDDTPLGESVVGLSERLFSLLKRVFAMGHAPFPSYPQECYLPYQRECCERLEQQGPAVCNHIQRAGVSCLAVSGIKYLQRLAEELISTKGKYVCRKCTNCGGSAASGVDAHF
ncbi:hypothetical protein R3P38DRAFT_2792953 [Favolaschia claudopus]|uniref:Uncharacterized protein n=1 Tax=Favolaschia claudopus TaxID=2862362 RepID=A0AAW0ADT0_9AGAR